HVTPTNLLELLENGAGNVQSASIARLESTRLSSDTVCQHICKPESHRTYKPLAGFATSRLWSTMRLPRIAWMYGANSLTACNSPATGASCTSGARRWKLPRIAAMSSCTRLVGAG